MLKNKIILILNSFFLVLIFLFGRELCAVHKTDDTAFQKWISCQKIYKDISLKYASKNLNDQFWLHFKQTYHDSQLQLKSLTPFLRSGFDANILSFESSVSKKSKKTMNNMMSWFENDFGKFFSYLKNNKFIDQSINQQEQTEHFNDVIEKYKTFLTMLLYHPDNDTHDAYHFAFANRLFEYCFHSPTFNRFYSTLTDVTLNQCNRFCYSIIWYYLVGEGWKHWHASSINLLANEARNGKEVVYIAGGNDIYQLLKNGIYTIRVIDPMLPSQPDYYAEDWEWLVNGDNGVTDGIGDVLEISCENKSLVLTRVSHEKNGVFEAYLSTGITTTLPKSITTWQVTDKKTDTVYGHVVFERRFCDQADFRTDKKRVLLLSFNELYFVGAPKNFGGWGIDVSKFDKKIKFFVKQLRKPVDKKILQNIQKSDTSNFSFILLGSSAT